MNDISEDFLIHYGVKRRSGRYPWGSGKEPYQHSADFLARVDALREAGKSEKEICEELGMASTDLRMQERVAKHERRELEVARVKSLREDGLTPSEIARKLGYANESSIRNLLNEDIASRKTNGKKTAEILKKELENKKMIDVGRSADIVLGCSEQTLKEAIFLMTLEGYNEFGVGIPQPTNPSHRTTTHVLARPEYDISYGYQHTNEIMPVGDYHSVDGGKSYTKTEYPSSLDSKRVQVVYGDEGGSEKDGVIEIRRGVKDLDMGNSHYAQVRIMVDGTHYMKGMAMYADDLPDGIDVRFNSNKSSGTPLEKVLKPIKEDPENPFGAYIKANGQSYYDDPKGKYINPETGNKASLSPINKLKEEGDWDTMSKNLSSQFLSKQPIKLIKQQLTLTYNDYESEYEDIKKLTNPTVKKKMLLDFADECDSAVVHLKAASLPRQSTQVILPVSKIKDDEVYAPNYKNGEKVALIRYPHAGIFEIPVLTVNNKNSYAKEILGTPRDAIGINSTTAQQLSGADFDGDQVVVIPFNDKIKINSRKPFSELLNFDAKKEYAVSDNCVKAHELKNDGYKTKEIASKLGISQEETKDLLGIKLMSKKEKQREMGSISNLITDMTLIGCNESEMIRAVKHSQVVIDAEKHKLDYKKSERDNGIKELQDKYQRALKADGSGGAATLLSRRKQTTQVPERKGSRRIDPDTGKEVFKESGRTYIDKKGKEVEAKTSVPILNYYDDAHVLSTGTIQEEAYADYANKLKALANDSRKEYLKTGRLVYSPSAKEAYRNEVEILDSKLRVARMNEPRERRAIAIANSNIKMKLQEYPELKDDKDALKKLKNTSMVNARIEAGADGKGTKISITPKEWEAIQSGAVSDTKLTEILRYADPDQVKEYATPRMTTELSKAKMAKIRAMSASGYTNAEIAEAIGRSASTVSKYLNSKQ